MTKNKQATIWITVAVTMLIVGAITYARQRPKQLITNEIDSITTTVVTVPDQIQVVAPAEITTSSPPTVADFTTTSTPTKKSIPIRKRKPVLPLRLSYGDAVAKYGNLRIQFAPKCAYASPNQIATKNPVTVMLDNRSDSTQLIGINGAIHVVNSYDYTIITVDQVDLPKIVSIACNGQYNVAQLFLQK